VDSLGKFLRKYVEVDRWIYDIFAQVDRLGIAENTVIFAMGDNGPFMQYARSSGQSNRIYRGGKADHLEGGVRVNAYISWPSVIEAGSYAGDIVHVSDLFTTLSYATLLTAAGKSNRHLKQDDTGPFEFGKPHKF
jgi:arylsulfatase A-like enzyme